MNRDGTTWDPGLKTLLAVLYMIMTTSLIRWCHTEMTGDGVWRVN